MKYIFAFLIINLFFIFNPASSQIITDKCSCRCRINQKTLTSFRYNAPVKKYRKVKVTFRTVFRKDVVIKSVDDGDLFEMFSDAQFMQYNARARWKFRSKGQNQMFIGTKTFIESGVSKNLSYIGFKKYF